jgi:tRNA(Ile)-lysidine synthase
VDVIGRVRATGLLEPERPVVVLLSGGRDSTCLLDVAVALAGAPAVRALHLNYGLRGAAADADERCCAALCDGLDVRLEVRPAPRPPGATGNVQAWARGERYAAGARAAAAAAGPLLTGHTLTDQVETILYRLASSPGRRALLGMDAVSPRVTRPLLAAGVTREETAAWCAARGLTWREDASNEDPAYARTRVREGLLPALRAVDPRAEGNVLRTAALLRDEAEVLEAAIAAVLTGRDEVEVDRLGALAPGLARLVLRSLAEEATGRSGARAAARLAEVVGLGDGALDLGDGARASVRGGVLRIVPTPRLHDTDSW